MSSSLHVPMRMCAVTREKLPKKGLLRFVGLKDKKKVVLDKGERVRGRGLNIRPDLETFDLAIKRKVFERAFGFKIEDVEVAKLRKEVDDYLDLKFREKKVVRITKEDLDNLNKK
jgi:hypothetical protein